MFLFLLPLVSCVPLLDSVTPNTFIMFFAPWCEHCKTMKSHWDLFYSTYNHEINIASVDCDVQPIVCQSYGVTSYPMLMFIDDNLRWYNYDDKVKIEKFANFAKEGFKEALEQGEPN